MREREAVKRRKEREERRKECLYEEEIFSVCERRRREKINPILEKKREREREGYYIWRLTERLLAWYCSLMLSGERKIATRLITL